MVGSDRMIHSFQNKTIVIFSPQPWNHISISKHHYALTLSENNTVYFISAPTHQLGKSDMVEKIGKSLFVIHYTMIVPELLKFKANKVYQFFIKNKVSKLLKKHVGNVDYLFDFGCYQIFNSTSSFPARYRIFFPVDDFSNLKGDPRGANIVFTVSTAIQKKFEPDQCFFINHGLSSTFVENAARELRACIQRQPTGKIRVGYAGNIFLRFINFEVFEELITSNPSVEFHLFGNLAFDSGNSIHQKWNSVIRNSKNVVIRGWLSASELVKAYDEIDMFLLCYKADNLNYHGENSHKILEYLSTGKVIVSSHISSYANNGLFEMDTSENNTLPIIFSRVISNIGEYNSLDRMQQRRQYAIDNSYVNQLERMVNIMNRSTY